MQYICWRNWAICPIEFPTVWIPLTVSLWRKLIFCLFALHSFILDSFLRCQVVLLCLLYSQVRDGKNKTKWSPLHVSGACWQWLLIRCCHQPFTYGTRSISYSLAVGITQDLPVTCLEGLSIAAVFLGTKLGARFGVDISVACIHPIPVFLTVPTPPQVVLGPSPRDLYFILYRECIFRYMSFARWGRNSHSALRNRCLVWGI